MTSQAQRDNYRELKGQAGAGHLLPWYYIGGQMIGANGEKQATLPPDVTIVEIRARGGAVNFAINGVNCSATSPGYIPEDGAEIIGPLYNLERLWVYGADATTYAHIMYFREY